MVRITPAQAQAQGNVPCNERRQGEARSLGSGYKRVQPNLSPKLLNHECPSLISRLQRVTLELVISSDRCSSCTDWVSLPISKRTAKSMVNINGQAPGVCIFREVLPFSPCTESQTKSCSSQHPILDFYLCNQLMSCRELCVGILLNMSQICHPLNLGLACGSRKSVGVIVKEQARFQQTRVWP